MKNFLYAFILLFMVTFAYAQGAINYVSFFPPNHVIHSDVVIGQDMESFNPHDIAYAGINDNSSYTAKIGGLILSAADNASTTIDHMDVTIWSNTKFIIDDFRVDNIIRVSALGTIDTIHIGQACSESSPSCQNTFISAGTVSLPLSSNYPQEVKFDIHVANLMTTNVSIGAWQAHPFVPLAGVDDKGLSWQKLRVKGTEECRWYLVKNYNPGDISYSDTPCKNPGAGPAS